MSGKHARKRHNRPTATTGTQDIREASLTNPSPVTTVWRAFFEDGRRLGYDWAESLDYADHMTRLV